MAKRKLKSGADAHEFMKEDARKAVALRPVTGSCLASTASSSRSTWATRTWPRRVRRSRSSSTSPTERPDDRPELGLGQRPGRQRCDLGDTLSQIEEYSQAASGLQNLGGGAYQFNWATPKSYASSCKTLHLDVAGVDHTADFRFTK